MRDLIVEYLKKHNLPVTRENYVALAFLGDSDGKEMFDAELEAELPEELQHPDFKGDPDVRR
jgi:hypothetical protein